MLHATCTRTVWNAHAVCKRAWFASRTRLGCGRKAPLDPKKRPQAIARQQDAFFPCNRFSAVRLSFASVALDRPTAAASGTNRDRIA